MEALSKGTQDTVESFVIGKYPQNFKLWDSTKKDERMHRLPWPLMDMTAVKIPVSWLPKRCLSQFMKLKKKAASKGEKDDDKSRRKRSISGSGWWPSWWPF